MRDTMAERGKQVVDDIDSSSSVSSVEESLSKTHIEGERCDSLYPETMPEFESSFSSDLVTPTELKDIRTKLWSVHKDGGRRGPRTASGWTPPGFCSQLEQSEPKPSNMHNFLTPNFMSPSDLVASAPDSWKTHFDPFSFYESKRRKNDENYSHLPLSFPLGFGHAATAHFRGDPDNHEPPPVFDFKMSSNPLWLKEQDSSSKSEYESIHGLPPVNHFLDDTWFTRPNPAEMPPPPPPPPTPRSLFPPQLKNTSDKKQPTICASFREFFNIPRNNPHVCDPLDLPIPLEEFSRLTPEDLKDFKWRLDKVDGKTKLPDDYSNFDYIQVLNSIPSGLPIPPKFAEDHERREILKAKKKENRSKWMKLVAGTEGFCTGEWRDSDMMRTSGGMEGWSPSCKYSLDAAEYAVSFLNKEGVEDEVIKLKRIVRVNGQILHNRLCTMIFFLTLEASDNKFYEALVETEKGGRQLKYVRPAKYYPEIPVHLRHLLGPE